MRLGMLPKDLKLDRPIWIHAVSVGEVMAVRGLLGELRKVYPDKRFVISTVTATGNKIAKGIAKDGDFVTYLPLDLNFIVKTVMDKISPSLFIIAETEIWPNLISYFYKKNIPIVTVNGRISDASFKGYLGIKILLKPILDKINMFYVQTERDARRFKALGVAEEKVQVTGNMKFDIKDYTDFKKDYTDLKQKLGLKLKEKLLVAGSTHPGEEEMILNVYKKLINGFPHLQLLIAPRHPERAKEIDKLVLKNGFQSLFISDLQRRAQATGRKTVFILDTIGELMSFYAIADIVFVGGSLIKKGGHNILEPASHGKPILFGPYMFNFRDITELFLENQAAMLVYSQQELKEKISYLLNHPDIIDTLASKAKNLILQNQGATRRNAEYIKAYYKYGD